MPRVKVSRADRNPWLAKMYLQKSLQILFTQVYKFCLHRCTCSIYTGVHVLFTQVYMFYLHRFTCSIYTGLHVLFTQVYMFCLHRLTDSVYTGLWVLFTQVYRFYFDTVPCQEKIFIWFKCCELWMVKRIRCSTKF
jgi:hypothetical protein